MQPHTAPRQEEWECPEHAGEGRATLNVKLVQMPKACIDHVIYHECCHLVEPHHVPAYYKPLKRGLPDWRERRERLNQQEMA